MNKNILIITGSPRKRGNTSLLAESFKLGAQEKGHEVTIFDAGSKKINGCTACNNCWSKGTACIFTDGFTELEPLLEKADVIVIASPLYWFGMSTQIKAPIDKLYAYVREACLRPLKIKESVLLVCGGDEDIQVFDGIIGTYKGIYKYMKWENKGIIAVPDVYELGDIVGREALAQARELGSSI
jgi:multimeric flavodoxin WrbA